MIRRVILFTLRYGLLLTSLFFVHSTSATASTLRASQTTVDTCGASPCTVEPNGGYGEYFNVYPLSEDPTDYVSEVEVYIVDNNSNGFTIEVCTSERCETSPLLKDGERVQNSWQGYDFSAFDLKLDSVVTVKVNDVVNNVYIGVATTDYYEYGQTTDSSNPVIKDIAFKIYGTTPPLASITLTREIVNDSGGNGSGSTLVAYLRRYSDVNNIPANSASGLSATYAVAAGTYEVVPRATTGNYTYSFSGDCDSEGAITAASAATLTCTIIFNDAAGSGGGRNSVVVETESSDPEPGISFPTISFSGRAYPGASVTIVKKVDGKAEVLKQGVYLEQYGNFAIGGIPAESLSYSLVVKDKFGRPGPTKTYTRKNPRDSLSVKNILFAPTVDFNRSTVSRGDVLKVIGSSFPDMFVQVKLDNGIIFETKSDLSGTYRVSIKSALLESGDHVIVARSIDQNTGQKSDFSATKNFTVSDLKIIAADLNGDNKINITDWSIFLEKWRQVKAKNFDLVSVIDFNGDDKVDISDFAIFLKAFSKK